MALIKTITPKSEVGSFDVDPTELTGADTLLYKPAASQVLYIRNESVGSVDIIIDGSDVTTVALPGQGDLTDNSGGYTVTVPAGAIHAVALVKIKNFLNTTQPITATAVTGGAADVFAWIAEV
jgi:hypothetical protein